MRKLLLAIAALQALVALAPSAYAQAYGRREAGVHGVGCYWHRGRHYCNRYCYREVDGYTFCQHRLRAAGSQAPLPVEFYWDTDEPRPRRR
jgi:hypothetical protein